MQIPALLLGLMACIALSGCNHSVNTRAGRTAPIAGTPAHLTIHREDAGAKGRLVAVDGRALRVADSDTEAQLLPGIRTIEITAYHGFKHAAAQLEFVAEAGHSYHVRAQLNGMEFRFRIWDETLGRYNRFLVLESTAPTGRSATTINHIAQNATDSRSYQMPSAPSWE